MANNIKKESKLEEVKIDTKKVITKYDKKVIEKKRKEAEARRNMKIFKISAIIALVAIVMGIASYFVVINNDKYGEYITVGDNKISKMEFDYYYNSTANQFVTTYASYLSYFN